jgi:hypothetical protein
LDVKVWIEPASEESVAPRGDSFALRSAPSSVTGKDLVVKTTGRMLTGNLGFARDFFQDFLNHSAGGLGPLADDGMRTLTFVGPTTVLALKRPVVCGIGPE